MTLNQKTILIIVSTFIGLLFILATTSDLILLNSYSSLEKAQVFSRTINISNQIEDRLKQLDVSAQEIAGCAQKSRLQSCGNLFAETYMRGHNLDLAALYDATGRLLRISGFDSGDTKPTQVSDERLDALAALVSQFVSQEAADAHGVVNLAGSPLMLALRHIKANKGSGSSVAVVGWFIDRLEMERIFRASGTLITTYDIDSNLEPDVVRAVAAINDGEAIYAGVIDSASVAGYFILKDFLGQPSFVVKSVEKRTLYEHGKVTIAYLFAALFIAGGVFCFVMLAFVRNTILNRLRSLTKKVGRITELRDVSARLPLSDHKDELNKLAVSINSMLDSLEQAESGMRESEERYRMLFDKAPDAIMIIGTDGDERGRIVAANQAAADQHGYLVDELLRLRIYDLNTPKTNAIASEIFDKIADGEWVTTEIWHQKKDGTQFPIEIHAGLIKIGDKNYTLGFDRDITERKLTDETNKMHLQQISILNDELSRKANDLAAMNNELETFNYSISHDMRGPLTRISGYCQLLLDADGGLDPTVREYVTRIYESEKWLNDMIDALIQLAQLTREEIVANEVNLSAITEEVLESLSLENPDRSVRPQVEPDIVVAGDSRLLKMAMTNLLENAWKYSVLNDDAFIEFGVERSEADPVYFVRDNGAGFEMKDADKLFGVFTRLHNYSQFTGTGIGLATVKRIISRHGGRIWAEAEPGVGATFYFTLS